MRDRYVYGSLFLVKVADSVSTYAVLSRGGFEANPYMASLMAFSPLLFYAATPLLFPLLIYLVMSSLRWAALRRGIRYTSNVIPFALVFLMLTVVYSNVQVYRAMTAAS